MAFPGLPNTQSTLVIAVWTTDHDCEIRTYVDETSRASVPYRSDDGHASLPDEGVLTYGMSYREGGPLLGDAATPAQNIISEHQITLTSNSCIALMKASRHQRDYDMSEDLQL